MAADGTQVDASAGSFTGFTLEPTRLTAAYLFNSRQSYQLRNFESVLRRDLLAVMSDAMDAQIVSGDGSAPNVTGFLSELTAPSRPSAADTYASYVSKFAGMIDGLNAYRLSDLRSVVNPATFQDMISEYRGTNDNTTAWEKVRELTGGISVSSRVPNTAVTGEASTYLNITALTSYPGRNAVAPIWRGLELIRDPYSNAGKGQVRLTAIAFWSFTILREAGWQLWKARTA